MTRHQGRPTPTGCVLSCRKVRAKMPATASIRELNGMDQPSLHTPSIAQSDRQVCVLVVEDDPALQRMILNYFAENNIRTLLASGRQEMVRQLGSNEVGLVVLD